MRASLTALFVEFSVLKMFSPYMTNLILHWKIFCQEDCLGFHGSSSETSKMEFRVHADTVNWAVLPREHIEGKMSRNLPSWRWLCHFLCVKTGMSSGLKKNAACRNGTWHKHIRKGFQAKYSSRNKSRWLEFSFIIRDKQVEWVPVRSKPKSSPSSRKAMMFSQDITRYSELEGPQNYHWVEFLSGWPTCR